MKKTIEIVKHIGDFTSAKDQQAIALTLMQSISDMLLPSFQSIIKTNPSNQILNQFLLKDGEVQFRDSSFETLEDFNMAMEHIEKNDVSEYSSVKNGKYLYVFIVSNTPHSKQFFVVQITHELTEQEFFLLSGMFKIFKNYNELINDSQTDELTGLLNRKTFDLAVTKFWSPDITPIYEGTESRNNDESKDNNWIIVIDIDHFKSINDKYGHLFGDEILILVANILKKSFRSSDLVFRFGGEEFVILLKGVSEKKCIQLAEKLRKDIEEYPFPKVESVTVSAGVCQFRSDIFYTTLLDYADRALYDSKNSGRNRVTFFDLTNDQGSSDEEAGEIDLF